MSRRGVGAPRGAVSRGALFALAALAAGGAALGALRGEPPKADAAPTVPGSARAAPPSPDTTFAGLIRRLSGEGAYFDTDNLISNETSYLHVAARLRSLRAPRLAYIGVGPDQNLSYVAALRPEVAFILDIRRDNLLHHLLLKALIEASPDRATYLAALFGRPPPPPALRARDADLETLLDWVEATPAAGGARPGETPAPDPELAARIVDYGLDLSDEDLATIARFHAEFIGAGPGLRFRSHGRAPRWYYPTYRELLLERDEENRRASYLADEADYRFVRELERRDRIVPVVGDFAGPHALRAIGREIERRGLRVGAFYTSNVEFYLYQQRTFGRFAASVATLPAAPGALMVRSYFHRGRPHPETRAGYASTQLAQPLAAFVRDAEAGGLETYDALIYGPVGALR